MPNAAEFKIFISAVTSEFEKAREEIAGDLRARGLTVKVERNFRQEADTTTTLEMLDQYIGECDAVVHLAGRRSGSFPGPEQMKPYAHLLPTGFSRGSYTQLEYLLARNYDRRVSIYIADHAYTPDRSDAVPDDDADQQRLHLGQLETCNRNAFDSIDKLCRLVLRETWPDRRQAKPRSDQFHSIGDMFKGRADALQELRKALCDGAAAIGAKAIHGLGGIGKTRLAVEYGCRNEADYAALLFLSGETPASLEEGLQKLAGVLRVENFDDLDERERRRAVLDWLDAHRGWFLLIDNLDTPEALAAAEGLLGHMSKGDVVITSRLSNFSARFTPLELDVLNLDAAADFLLARTDGKRRKAPDDLERAREIAGELGRLALALEQAGAYIARRRSTFADYLRDWRAESDRLMDFHDATVTGYPRSVAVTWATSFAQLSAPARRLLEVLAFLAPEPAPEALLDTNVHGVEGNTRDAFDQIADYSLVFRKADAPYFSMHRLVQAVTRRSLDAQARELRIAAALLWLVAATKEQEGAIAPQRRKLLMDLLLHGVELVRCAEGAPTRQGASFLLTAIGDACVEAGAAITAREAFSAGLALDEALARTCPGNAQIQRDLSISYSKMCDLAANAGDDKAARKASDYALAIAEALAKADPENTEAQRDLAVRYRKVFDLCENSDGEAAREAIAKAFTITKALAKADPGNTQIQRDLAISYDKMGVLSVAAGDGKAARKAFGKGLKVIKALADADPGNTFFQRDLALFQERLGDLALKFDNGEGAQDAFRKALAVRMTLAAIDPGNAKFQRELIIPHIGLAICGLDPAHHYAEALNIAENLDATGRLQGRDAGLVDLLRNALTQTQGD